MAGGHIQLLVVFLILVGLRLKGCQLVCTYPSLLAVGGAPFIGSFLATVSVRLPREEGVVLSRSHCRTCERNLSAMDLIPILSWLRTHGRCRHCGSPVSWRYPAVELISIAVAIWSVLAFQGWQVWVACLLGYLLLTLALVDFEHLYLPDELTAALLMTGLLVAYVVAPATIASHVAAAVTGYAAFWLISRLYASLRHREGLGLGDAKLMAGAGAWVSLSGLPWVVFIGSMTALLYVAGRMVAHGRMAADTPVPFGAFLCLGTWVVWTCGALMG